ncbi:MAG: hypothetical protein M0027_12695 [Candidatus Dormibacteraeota bacterium]|nr:hypothetical protein [Candidatus Dormibacteraeota bacterium]
MAKVAEAGDVREHLPVALVSPILMRMQGPAATTAPAGFAAV